MKTKILLAVIISLVIAGCALPIYAEEFTFSEEDAFAEDIEGYIPEYVEEVLQKNELDIEDISPNDVLGQCLKEFVSDISDNNKYLLIIMVVIMLNSLTKRLIITNRAFTIEFVSKLSIICVVIDYTSEIMRVVTDCVSELDKLLNSLLPSFVAVHLLGGANYSAVASSASVTMLSGVIGKMFGDKLTDVARIVLCIFVFERFSPQLRKVGLSKTLKKSLVSVVVFVFSMMISLVGLNGSLATAKDSAALKTMRFAASNIVPIIGSSVSEAMKTVSAGVTYLKVYMCVSSAYALLILTLPTLLKLFCFRFIMRLSAITSGLLSDGDDLDVFDGISGISDIFIAVIIGIMISVFFLIISFSNFALSINV